MNLLLDTHVLLWWLNDDEKLTKKHRDIILDTDNLCYISAATIWEISIKVRLGKLEISDSYIHEISSEGFLELPISWIHTNEVNKLPLIHKDPFDRLLISQSRIEDMTLLTVDEHIKKYEVKVL